MVTSELESRGLMRATTNFLRHAQRYCGCAPRVSLSRFIRKACVRFPFAAFNGNQVVDQPGLTAGPAWPEPRTGVCTSAKP
jgi:hypothetical protein